MTATLIAGALIVDAVVGDPKRLYARVPHPVTLMAGSLMALERRLNRPAFSPDRRRILGVLALGLYLAVWGTGAVLLADALSGPAGTIALILLASTLLAGRDLINHVRAVMDALAPPQDLEAARAAVSQIVGRDVSVLDAPGIARGALESLAENFSDGLVAPLFWFAVAGFPGLVCYKAINTADSMIGHRDERFAAFGWAAARLDDAANLVPARLTAGLIALAAIPEGRTGAVWAAAWADARKHLSPNAGWPEAAMAGALGLRLGGPRRYGEEAVDGAWFGTGRDDADALDIGCGVRLVTRAWLMLVVGAALMVVISN